MSAVVICNYCGVVIDDDAMSATVDTAGRFPSGGLFGDSFERWTAHYHTSSSDGMSCFDRVYGAVELVEQMGPSLEAIPVATDAEISSLRPATYVAAEVEAAVARQDSAMSPLTGGPGYRQRKAILGGPGGIAALGLPWGIEKLLDKAGVLTIATLKRRAGDGTLANVPGIGQGRLALIEEVIANRCAPAGTAHTVEAS